MKSLGVMEKDYMKAHDELTKKWGFNPRHRDIFWSLFNKILINSMKEGNSEKYRLIQEYMYKFRSEEKRFGGIE